MHKLNLSKEWIEKNAQLEEGHEISAGIMHEKARESVVNHFRPIIEKAKKMEELHKKLKEMGVVVE